jgi:hypothetical protein
VIYQFIKIKILKASIMRNKKQRLSTVLLLCFVMFRLQAQQVVTTSGGNASGGGGTVSYTVGQVVYTTNGNSNGSVAQGVQQPYEISVVTGIVEAKDISLEIMVYPNPATDFIKLKIENYKLQSLRYQLYNTNGSLLQVNKIVGNETNIVMSNLVSATYFLKVTDNNKVIKTFKIIKH